MKKRASLAAIALLPVLLSACAATPPAVRDTVEVTGSAGYRERIALAPDATMTVRVENISRADAPATVLGEQRIPLEGRQAPIPFAVEVPRASLEAAVRTSARVRIDGPDGRLLWTTDQVYPVSVSAGEDTVDLGPLLLVSTAR